MTTCGHLRLACFAGTRSASSLSFHFMRNISSPDVSVAPMIFSGTSPRSKPSLRSDFFLAIVVFLASTTSWALRFFDSSSCAEDLRKCDKRMIELSGEQSTYPVASYRSPQTHWSARDSQDSPRAPKCCPHCRSLSTSGNIRPAKYMQNAPYKVTVSDEIGVMVSAIRFQTHLAIFDALLENFLHGIFFDVVFAHCSLNWNWKWRDVNKINHEIG